MTITSTYSIGDKVWALGEFGTYYECTIVEIASWDKWTGFRYEVQHNGIEQKYFTVEERSILPSRQDIIDNKIVSELSQHN